MLGCLGVTFGPSDKAPTEYAATGPAEDFAESVRFYVTQPDKLMERSPLRYRYLKNSVFCGYEYGSN
jgi:Mlc titration factor MtfA (ptsG expression regulator)